MKAHVTWHQGLSFKGESESGFQVNLGANTQVGGANDGFRPLELMAISLAGCTAMDVISILTKKKQDVTSFKVEVMANQAEEYPRVFTSAVVNYIIIGHAIDEKAVLRAIELSSTTYCPAQAMLGKVMSMELTYEIHEQNGGEQSQLVTKGQYIPVK